MEDDAAEMTDEKNNDYLEFKNGRFVKTESVKKFGAKKASLVKEAVRDLDNEIGRIRKEKSSVNSEIKSIDSGLENAQQLERRLKAKIAKLEEKEAELTERKKKIKQKSDSLGEKLTKVKNIKDQLSEL